MTFKFTLLIVLFPGFVSTKSFGAESVSAAKLPKATASSAGYSLPKCVDQDAQLAKIKDHMQTTARAEKLAAKVNPKSASKTTAKYDELKAAVKSEDDDIVVARLIYAEVKAAHCPELDQKTSHAIGAVIKNRIRAQNGNVAKVVFQKDQFASSVNIYDIDADEKGPAAHSSWKEFLCPTDTAAWDQALKVAKSGKSEIPGDVFNYYLLKHSTRFPLPDWAKKEAVVFAGYEKFVDCVKLIRLPYP